MSASDKKLADAAKPVAAHPAADAKPAPALPFVRVGGRLVNFAHVASVDLPVAGDPKKPLTLHFASGTCVSLTGADADAVLAALGNAE